MSVSSETHISCQFFSGYCLRCCWLSLAVSWHWPGPRIMARPTSNTSNTCASRPLMSLVMGVHRHGQGGRGHLPLEMLSSILCISSYSRPIIYASFNSFCLFWGRRLKNKTRSSTFFAEKGASQRKSWLRLWICPPWKKNPAGAHVSPRTKDTSPLGWASRHVGSSEQDSTRTAEFPRRLELASCILAFNLYNGLRR